MEGQELEVAEADSSEDLVPLHEASDEDLDAYLTSGDKEESTQPEAEEKTVAQDSPEEGKTEPATEPEKQEAEKVTLSKEEYAQLTKRLETSERRVKDKEQFIQRQATEVGSLRKERERLASENEKLSKVLEADSFESSPKQLLDAHAKIQENNKQIRSLETQEAQALGRSVIERYVPADDLNVDLMAASLERDGLDENLIRGFRSDPFSPQNMHPETFIQLAKRAKAEDALVRVVDWARQTLEQKDKEIEALKQKPQEVLKGVEKALKQAPTVTAATGGGATSEYSVPTGDPSEWDDATLDEFLKKEVKRKR